MSQNREPLSEFAIISRFFSDLAGESGAIDVGVGDDCALLKIPPGQRLAMSIDTVVEGRHFPASAAVEDIAYRAVAVAASDLAAMGATPLAATLALALPGADESWLQQFSRGLRAALGAFDLSLIGGDTTRGPLTITVQVHGLLPDDRALLRSGAKPGDRVFVSGNLGDAAAALAMFAGELDVDPSQREYLYRRFYRPSPRLDLGCALLPVAASAIDISDGLLADLGHILECSGVGARVYVDRLPLSGALQSHSDRRSVVQWALTGGDDYELCFTVAEDCVSRLEAIAAQCDVSLTEIGEIVAGAGLQCLDADGEPVALETAGYQHFSEE